MEYTYLIITYFCTVFGLVGGSYILWQAFFHRDDPILFVNMLILGIAQILMGIIYTEIASKGTIPLYTASSLSVYLRPVVSFTLLMPALIIKRIGL